MPIGNKASLLVGLALVCVVALSASLPAGDAPGPERIETVADLNGKRLGILAGTVLDNAANDALDFTRILYYDDTAAEIEALLAGEIDAFIDDEPVARYLAGTNPLLRKVEGTLIPDSYGFAAQYGDDEFYNALDGFLGEMLTDGTVDALERKWIDSPDEEGRVMPDLPEVESGRVLRFGVSPVSAPFVYENADGEVIGLDLELMDMIARRMNRRLEVVSMEFSELVPSLLRGRVDVIGSCLSITEERQAIIRFTRPCYEGGVAAITLADGAGGDE